MRYNHLFPAFSTGLVSDRYNSRVDIPSYNYSCRQLENFIVDPSGIVRRRQGSKYLAHSATAISRLIPTGNVVIAFGTTYYAIYDADGPVFDTSSNLVTNGDFPAGITSWTDTSSGTGSIAHDAVDLRLQLIGVGAGNEARAEQNITGLTATVFNYKLVVSAYGGDATVRIGTTTGASDIYSGTVSGLSDVHTFNTSATSIYLTFENADSSTVEIDDVLLYGQYHNTHSFSTGVLDIDYAIYENNLYITHGDFEPIVISLLDYSSTAYAQENGPWDDYASNSGTMTPSGTSGSVTFTASVSTFASTDVGRLIRFRSVSSAAWGWGKITAYASPTSVTVSIQKTLDAAAASLEWRLGAWGNTVGWPKYSATHENRLVFANSTADPSRVWATMSNSAIDFNPDNDTDNTSADSGYVYAISKARDITFIEGRESLIVGSKYNVLEVYGGNEQGINPTVPPVINVAANVGAGEVWPITTYSAILYSSRGYRKMYKLTGTGYRKDNTYNLVDMLGHVQELQDADIKTIVVQTEPYRIVWVLLDDSTIFSGQYLNEAERPAWSKVTFGGTSGSVQDIAVVNTDSSQKLFVARTTSELGTTVEVIDLFESIELGHLDSYVEYSGSSTLTPTGFDVFDGTSVRIIADGNALADQVVSSGSLALSLAASNVRVGLGFDSTLETNSIPAGNRRGAAEGIVKRIHEINVRYYETRGANVGYDSSNLSFEPFNENQIYGSGPALFTGYKTTKVNSGYGRSSVGGDYLDPTIIIKSEVALPLSIQSITVDVTLSET